jgi:hypothetical protein
MKKSLYAVLFGLLALTLLPAAAWAASCPAAGCNVSVAPSSFGTLVASTPSTLVSGGVTKIQYMISSSVYLSAGVYTYVYTFKEVQKTGHVLSVGSGLFDTVGLKFGYLLSGPSCPGCTTTNIAGSTFSEASGPPGVGSFVLQAFAHGIPPGKQVTYYAQSLLPPTLVDFSGLNGGSSATLDGGVYAPLPEPTSAMLLLTLVGCLALIGGSRMGWRSLTSS